MALWAMLAMALALTARPAAAAPFAYVTNFLDGTVDGTVSVIDTATNTVVGLPITVGRLPNAVAVTPDGKRVYVANQNTNNVSVIDAASNTVVATVPVGIDPHGIAVAPDGKHAYVTVELSKSVSVIETATDTVVATVPVGNYPLNVAVTPDGKHAYVGGFGPNTVSVIDTASNAVVFTIPGIDSHGIAVTPDGKHAYVTGGESNSVSVIDTATNTFVATVTVDAFPSGVAITPDGTHAYVANDGIRLNGTVSVIDTASNTVVATVPVGSAAGGVAVTPDGKHAYVTSGTVSVIDTASNTVVATVTTVGGAPYAIGIIPPPPGVPFAAFGAKLAIDLDHKPNPDAFELVSVFTLGQSSNGINPVAEPVTLQVGAFTTTIPAGSFTGTGFGPFTFGGVVDGVTLQVRIEPTGTKRYALKAEARHPNLAGTKNPVPVTLTIGDDSGSTSVKADIDH